MNDPRVLADDDQLDPLLRIAVDAVRSTAPPPEASSRVIARARQLRPPRRSWPARLAIPVTVAAMLIVGAVALWVGTGDVLADVAAAVAERPWLHGVAAGEEQVEFWFSPQEGIMATRQGPTVLLLDQKQGMMDVWSGETDAPEVIVRKPLDVAQRRLFNSAQDGLQAILAGNLRGVAPTEGERIVSRGRERRQVDGQELIVHRLVIETGGADPTQRELTLGVDPRSTLPLWYETRFDEETSLRFDLSYPDKGPYTIHGLGVPQTAQVESQRPSGELQRVLAAMKRARTRFDAYRGLTISSVSSADPRDGGGGIFYATACQGTKWRVDKLRIPASWMLKARVPDGEDPAQWWLRKIDGFESCPYLISDGSHQWLFTAVYPDPPRLDPENPELAEIESLKRQNRGALYPADDPSPYSMSELPHFMGYHDGHATDMLRTAQVEAHPESGPENTLLVKVRQVSGKAGQNYWVDPARGYLVVRREYLRTIDGELQVDGVLEVVESAVTPQGFWYPTVVRSPDSSIHLETGVRSDSYTRYYLDFDAEFPDELFDASKAAVR